MSATSYRYVYGPVQSRRLGRSLGIDLVPFKTCTYNCIYCQLGQTTNKTLERKEYVPTASVLMEVEQKLASGEIFDCVSMAGSGEPTLHSGIGNLILEIKKMTEVPIAVLTNGSLLWIDDVQKALMPASLILPSLDVGSKSLFQRVNRPHPHISFEQMVNGLVSFANRFKRDIWLEVLLLEGITGIPREASKIAAIIKRIAPTRIQLNTVIRPAAEVNAHPVSEAQMLALKDLLPGKVEIISEGKQRGVNKSSLSNARSIDILNLLWRRPCTCIEVANSLGMHPSETIKDLDELIASGKVITKIVDKRAFYSAIGFIDASRS
jgi:wyosine [tRNA(Phe)-imidazoG37] synthetase (radical SAM superfamily)